MGCPTYIISVHHRPADAVKLEHISLYIRMFSSCPLCVCVHACSKQWCGNRRAFAIYRMRDKSMWNALSGIYAYCAVILPLAKLYYIHTLTMCYCSFKCLAKVSARLCVQANAQFIICISVCVCVERGEMGADGRLAVHLCVSVGGGIAVKKNG